MLADGVHVTPCPYRSCSSAIQERLSVTALSHTSDVGDEVPRARRDALAIAPRGNRVPAATGARVLEKPGTPDRSSAMEVGPSRGYVIVAGLLDVNRSIEFRRIVIAEKGQGFGKEAVRLVKTLAFDELRAHRLWLDVKEHNLRAQHAYEAECFAIEGTSRECLRTDEGYESLVLVAILETEYRSYARHAISSGEDQAGPHPHGSQSC